MNPKLNEMCAAIVAAAKEEKAGVNGPEVVSGLNLRSGCNG